jgi:hypothetical protein
MPVTTLDDLHEHLQWAIELEHATLPPYFCALASIIPGTNKEAIGVLTSVFLEEMLHMTLAANLLNAVGGAPVIDSPDFTPRYPAYLPHSANGFLVHLAPFSPQSVETFMRIEKPEDGDAPPEAERYDTIGQFYRALEDGVRSLCAEMGETRLFCGDPARQITPDVFDYTGSGRIIPVFDLASALAAIEEIEEQGEGLKHAEVWDGDRDMFHPSRDEVAHYFRFVEIREARWFRRGDTPSSGPTGDRFDVDWSAVYPMRENSRVDDYPAGSPVRTAMEAFNAVYGALLGGLDRAFNGDPWHLYATTPTMSELTRLARELMRIPSGDGETTAGPSFEYVGRAGR